MKELFSEIDALHRTLELLYLTVEFTYKKQGQKIKAVKLLAEDLIGWFNQFDQSITKKIQYYENLFKETSEQLQSFRQNRKLLHRILMLIYQREYLKDSKSVKACQFVNNVRKQIVFYNTKSKIYKQ